VVVANGIILHTNDGGAQWARQTSDTASNLDAIIFTSPAAYSTTLGRSGE
jgi:photosystem II stability/assembly factor-like uncharacterized protein